MFRLYHTQQTLLNSVSTCGGSFIGLALLLVLDLLTLIFFLYRSKMVVYRKSGAR